MIPRDRWSIGQILAVGAVILGVAVVVVAHPPQSLLATPFPGEDGPERAPSVSTVAGAFGASGEVRVQLRLPGELFEFPVDVKRGSEAVEYLWVNADDSVPMTPTVLLTGSTVAAPSKPGFYKLEIARPNSRTLVDSIIVGVMVPFSSKLGASINGYQIGTYNAERGDGAAPPRAARACCGAACDTRNSRSFACRVRARRGARARARLYPKFVDRVPRTAATGPDRRA
jgi:hypothetical protein